ncbi:MAG TPA: hypothetical protein VIK92_02485 [Thermaerobacter sp.]
MRERLKPVARAAFLLMFAVIAYLWQRQTGGGAGYLLLSTLAVLLGVILVAGALFAVLGWIMRAGSGPQEAAGREEPAGQAAGRPGAARAPRVPARQVASGGSWRPARSTASSRQGAGDRR